MASMRSSFRRRQRPMDLAILETICTWRNLRETWSFLTWKNTCVLSMYRA